MAQSIAVATTDPITGFQEVLKAGVANAQRVAKRAARMVAQRVSAGYQATKRGLVRFGSKADSVIETGFVKGAHGTRRVSRFIRTVIEKTAHGVAMAVGVVFLLTTVVLAVGFLAMQLTLLTAGQVSSLAVAGVFFPITGAFKLGSKGYTAVKARFHKPQILVKEPEVVKEEPQEPLSVEDVNEDPAKNYFEWSRQQDWENFQRDGGDSTIVSLYEYNIDRAHDVGDKKERTYWTARLYMREAARYSRTVDEIKGKPDLFYLDLSVSKKEYAIGTIRWGLRDEHALIQTKTPVKV